MKHAPPARFTMLLALALLLVACGDARRLAQQVAQPIGKDDVCAVCGMYIGASPGPRAEAYVEGRDAPLKFDSTRDFFAYVLQPENKASLQSLFVQDTARIDWDHPSGAADRFIDARSAYYVAWQPLPGSMGPTFASFARQQDAASFVADHGGEIFRYGELTPELITLLGYACPAADTLHSRHAQACVRKQAALRQRDLVSRPPSA